MRLPIFVTGKYHILPTNRLSLFRPTAIRCCSNGIHGRSCVVQPDRLRRPETIIALRQTSILRLSSVNLHGKRATKQSRPRRANDRTRCNWYGRETTLSPPDVPSKTSRRLGIHVPVIPFGRHCMYRQADSRRCRVGFLRDRATRFSPISWPINRP